MPEKTQRGGCLPLSLAFLYEHCFSFNWFHSWRPFAKCNYARLSPSVCVQEEPSLSVFLFSIFINPPSAAHMHNNVQDLLRTHRHQMKSRICPWVSPGWRTFFHGESPIPQPPFVTTSTSQRYLHKPVLLQTLKSRLSGSPGKRRQLDFACTHRRRLLSVFPSPVQKGSKMSAQVDTDHFSHEDGVQSYTN